jgi:maltooligosyltrehalose trehalohydrolase
MRWSSEHPDYDGTGAVNPLTDRGWQLPAESAVLFTAV